jgi:hypothetical protein
MLNFVVRTPGRTNADQQAAVNMEAAAATEQAIDAAADGDIDAGTAADVGTITATDAALYAQRYGNSNMRWTGASDYGKRRLHNFVIRTSGRTDANQQAAVNMRAAAATEQAIAAAADGDIDAGTAAGVGTITATEASLYAQRYGTHYTTHRHWTGVSSFGKRRLSAAAPVVRQLAGSNTNVKLQAAAVDSSVTRKMLENRNRHRDNLVDQQNSISTYSEANTEPAIDAAVDGTSTAADAANVGTVSASVAAELADGRRNSIQQPGVSN